MVTSVVCAGDARPMSLVSQICICTPYVSNQIYQLPRTSKWGESDLIISLAEESLPPHVYTR